MKIKRIFLVGIAMMQLSLAGCGGGGGDTLFSSTPGDAGAGGLWYGELSSDTEGRRPVFAIVTEQGVAQFILSGASGLHLAGTISTADSMRLSGDMSCYLDSDVPFVGIDGVEPMSLEGTIDPRQGMSGRYGSETDSGRFNLVYSEAYENPSSLDRIAGLYQYDLGSSGGGSYTLTLDVNDSGAVFGQDTTSCTYSGRIAVIDAHYNAYDVDLAVSTCGGMDGTYHGLASLTSIDTARGTALMVLAAARGDLALVARLSR